MKKLIVAVLPAVFALVGCGGDGEGAAERPETAAVKVIVNYKGAPVADATVTFSPQAAQGRAAYGKTGKKGVAEVKTFSDGEGVVPGEYNVAITKLESRTGSEVSMDDPAYDGGENVSATPSKSLIPGKYANAATSELTANVEAGQDNQYVFDLVD